MVIQTVDLWVSFLIRHISDGILWKMNILMNKITNLVFCFCLLFRLRLKALVE